MTSNPPEDPRLRPEPPPPPPRGREDAADVAAALLARGEAGTIPWEQLKSELGLLARRGTA